MFDFFFFLNLLDACLITEDVSQLHIQSNLSKSFLNIVAKWLIFWLIPCVVSGYECNIKQFYE